MPENKPSDYLYIFLDESGDLIFSAKRSKYFILTCVTKTRPFLTSKPVEDLKFNLIERGFDLEYFHASMDKKFVRYEFYSLLENSVVPFKVDSIVIEKRKTHPKIQDVTKFYPMMMTYLLNYVFNGLNFDKFKHVNIITDMIPVEKKREAIKKAIKTNLATRIPENMNYTLMHHSSKSCFGLQLADYYGYAI